MKIRRLIPNLLLTVTLAAFLGLAACSSSDDDNGGDPNGGMQPGGGEQPTVDTASDAASQPADSDPLPLNRAALAKELRDRFGDPDLIDPFPVEDGDTATSLLGGQ